MSSCPHCHGNIITRPGYGECCLQCGRSTTPPHTPSPQPRSSGVRLVQPLPSDEPPPDTGKFERAVSEYLKQPKGSQRHYGESNGNHKLTGLGVRVIRKLKGRIGQCEVAGIFQVSQAHVSQIQAGEQWRGK